MELIIYKSMIYGDLRPWLPSAARDKFYRQQMPPGFCKPKELISEYYEALRKMHGNDKPDLFKEDGLEIYMMQPDTKTEQHDILHPLIETSLQKPVTTTQRFYHFLLINETTRLTDRVFKCINKDIADIQNIYIIQNVVRSCKDLLLKIGIDSPYLLQKDLTNYVIPQLITHLIRFLKETEKLYSHFLTTLPSTKHELFGELLRQDIPAHDIDTTTPTFTTANNILLDVDNYTISKNDRFTFGFHGCENKLKSVLVTLNRNFTLLDQDKTTVKALLSVLVNKELTRGAPQIHLGCPTNQFSHVISEIKSHFSNLTPTTIGRSNLFYSKNGTLLKRNNLYKELPFSTERNAIDAILKQL